jgi:hypothetical protein
MQYNLHSVEQPEWVRIRNAGYKLASFQWFCPFAAFLSGWHFESICVRKNRHFAVAFKSILKNLSNRDTNQLGHLQSNNLIGING